MSFLEVLGKDLKGSNRTQDEQTQDTSFSPRCHQYNTKMFSRCVLEYCSNTCLANVNCFIVPKMQG